MFEILKIKIDVNNVFPVSFNQTRMSGSQDVEVALWWWVAVNSGSFLFIDPTFGQETEAILVISVN